MGSAARGLGSTTTGSPQSFTFLICTMGRMLPALQDGCVGNKQENVCQWPRGSIQTSPCYGSLALWHQPRVILPHLLLLIMFAGIESACFLSFSKQLPPSLASSLSSADTPQAPGPRPGALTFPSLTPILLSQACSESSFIPTRPEPSPPTVG